MPSPRSRSASPRSLGNLLSRRPPSPTPPPAPGAADELGRASSDPTNSSSDPIRRASRAFAQLVLHRPVKRKKAQEEEDEAEFALAEREI